MKQICRAASACTLLCAQANAADGPIGFVKVARGDCFVRHDDLVIPAHPGVPVFVRDVMQTGGNGALGVTFRDNTRVALGPRSRVIVPVFRFAPAERQYGFVLRLLVGTMEYISGLTAKLAPDSMSIETPSATIGVRGTRFVVRAGE
jgi:hypothetical protein